MESGLWTSDGRYSDLGSSGLDSRSGFRVSASEVAQPLKPN
jgi:hypothetical protein